MSTVIAMAQEDQNTLTYFFVVFDHPGGGCNGRARFVASSNCCLKSYSDDWLSGFRGAQVAPGQGFARQDSFQG